MKVLFSAAVCCLSMVSMLFGIDILPQMPLRHSRGKKNNITLRLPLTDKQQSMAHKEKKSQSIQSGRPTAEYPLTSLTSLLQRLASCSSVPCLWLSSGSPPHKENIWGS